MSHTPGPWELSAQGSVYGSIEPQRHSLYYRKLIRPAIQTKRQAAEYGGTLAEQTANARLIAAAPELLTALEDLAAGFSVNSQADEIAIKNARAAIAKAT